MEPTSPPPAAARHWTSTDDRPKLPRRDWAPAVLRGLRGRCPHCGEGRLFRGYLKVVDRCAVCGEEFHHHRADDFPPYITMFIVGHLVVPVVLTVETAYHLAAITHMMIWLPVTLLLCLLLIQPVKGAVVGLQWALRMHGFHPAGDITDAASSHWAKPLGR